MRKWDIWDFLYLSHQSGSQHPYSTAAPEFACCPFLALSWSDASRQYCANGSMSDDIERLVCSGETSVLAG